MPAATPTPGDGSLFCRECGELLSPGSRVCPICKARAPMDDLMKSARDRLMWLARQMPQVASEARSVEQLCAGLLDIVVPGTGAKYGAVWDLGVDPGQQWNSRKLGPLPATCSTLRHSILLRHVLNERCGMVLPPDSVAIRRLQNTTGYLLVLSPFSTDVIRSGVVEILQRPDAPQEAGAGYLMFLEQMMEYFTTSPVLNSGTSA